MRILTFTFLATLSLQAAEYKRGYIDCHFTGTRQDIFHAATDLPYKAKLRMFGITSSEGEVIHTSYHFSPVMGSATALTKSFLNKIHRESLFGLDMGGGGLHFNVSLEKKDIMDLIRHLGGNELELSDPATISASPWKLYLYSASGHRVQLHLPSNVKNGLSFHVWVSCGGLQILSEAITLPMNEIPPLEETVVWERKYSKELVSKNYPNVLVDLISKMETDYEEVYGNYAYSCRSEGANYFLKQIEQRHRVCIKKDPSATCVSTTRFACLKS